MLSSRYASALAPLVLRNGARTAIARQARLQRQIPSLLVAQRQYATETSTNSGNDGNYPPPGFNAEQAKKPLPTDGSRKSSPTTSGEATSVNAQTTQTKSEGSLSGEDKKAAMAQQNVTEVATAKTTATKAGENKLEEVKKEQPKLSIMQKVKKEVLHYWDGTKLLATEVRISFKLALKMAAGYELTRREHRQLPRHVCIARHEEQSPSPHGDAHQDEELCHE